MIDYSVVGLVSAVGVLEFVFLFCDICAFVYLVYVFCCWFCVI